MRAYTGIKLVAGISFICAAILLGGCSWTFRDSLLDLKQQLNDSGVLQVEPKRRHYVIISESKAETYDDILTELLLVWSKNQPVLSSLSAIAIVTGTIQLLASFSLLISDSKTIRVPTRRWFAIHILVYLTLLVVMISTVLIKRNHGKSTYQWSVLLEKFQVKLKEKQPNEDFSGLISELKKGLAVFYGCVGQDMSVMLLLFFAASYFLRKLDYDYEIQR